MRGRNRRRAVIPIAVAAVTATVLVFAAGAQAYIYWTDRDSGTIGRAANDGSVVEPEFIKGIGLPQGVAVNSTHIFWTNGGQESIGRANIDGTGVNQKFVPVGEEPAAVAVGDSYVFWTTTFPSAVGRANLDGSSPVGSLVSEVELPCGVAVDGGHVYWSSFDNPSTIGRASLGGLNPEHDFVEAPETGAICGIAVNSLNIFWSELGLATGTRIGRADVSSGGGVDTSFIDGGSAPCGVALFGPHLYWANLGSGTIGRANIDGSAVDQSHVSTGGGEICGVAVDSLAPPPQPPAPPGAGGGQIPADASPPQTRIVLGPRNAVDRGRASFLFHASEAATFTCKLDARKAVRCGRQGAVTCKALGPQCLAHRSYSGLAPGRHIFRVWATDTAGNKDPTPAKRRFRVPAR